MTGSSSEVSSDVDVAPGDAQAAPGHGRRVGQATGSEGRRSRGAVGGGCGGVRHRRAPSRLCSSSGRPAGWPVRARNTSSRVALCTANRSTARRAGSTSSSRARTWAALPSVATPMVRRAGSRWTARPSRRRATSLEGGGVGQHQVEALAGDLLLELGRGAVGDHPAAVEHGDAVGQPVGLLQVLGGQEARSPPRRPGRRRPATPPGGCAGPGRWSARPGRSPTGRPTRPAARSRRRRMPPE